MSRTYNTLYTEHFYDAADANTAVGGGDEDVVGRAQVQALQTAGLLKGRRWLEIGCGTGRIWTVLADHARDEDVHYLGLDVVHPLVTKTRGRLAELGLPADRFTARWTDGESGFPEGFGATAVWGFSVFTHMEAEDITRTLRELAACCAPGALGLFTFLALENEFGKVNFEQELALSHEPRFDRVRNIAFTLDMATRLVELAGWTVRSSSWTEHPDPYDEAGHVRTNQSWLVLELPGG